MLSGLLLGQDVLTLKNGESYKGIFFDKLDEGIVFKIEGETSTKNFSINDVSTIVTKNGELTYPFYVPISHSVYKDQGMSAIQKNVFICCAGACLFTIWLMYYLFEVNLKT